MSILPCTPIKSRRKPSKPKRPHTMTRAEALTFEAGKRESSEAMLLMQIAERQAKNEHPAPCVCRPYEDIFTFNRWRALDRTVRKGAKSFKLAVVHEDEDEKGNKIKRFVRSSVFCRCMTCEPGTSKDNPWPYTVSEPVIVSEQADITPTPKLNLCVAPPTGSPKLAERLRNLADNLEADIDNCCRPMAQNPTPKRVRQYNQRLHEGKCLRAAQSAMRALADAHDADTVLLILADVRTKSEIISLMRYDSEHTGYYEFVSLDTYADKSDKARALQELTESAKSDADRKAEFERVRADKIRRLEEGVRRFRPDGFFPTPQKLISKMLENANIESGHTVAEPSAGKGDIAEAIAKTHNIEPDCYEINFDLREILGVKGLSVAGFNWLDATRAYDRIIMNPPFERGQDIQHVQHAYDCLKPGGRLVAIMSEGCFFRSNARRFRNWLDSVNSWSERLPADSFKSGFCPTSVSTRLVVIDKEVE